MAAAVWKMHHPCFLYFFGSDHTDDVFRLRGGLFYLWESSGIAAEPRGGFFASLPTDINRSNNAVRANSSGRHKQ